MASKQSMDDKEAQPSTSKSKMNKPLQKETLQLISRVLEKCELDKSYNVKSNELPNSNDLIKRAQYFTGLHPKYLEKLKNGESTNFDVTTVSRHDVQNELVDFYSKSKLPTTYELFDAMQGRIPEYMDIRSFRKALVKLGYMWRKINKNNELLVIIERPSVTFERYFYLKNIIRYREDFRQIYFVDELILTATCEVYDSDSFVKFKSYIPKGAILKHVICAVTNQAIQFAIYDNYDPTNTETWLKTQLFRSVTSGNVVVLRNKKHVNTELLETPTLNSLKIEMKDWLDFYNVPYEENMSKIDLYTLVEKFTNNIDKLYKIDTIAKTFGVEILRLPESISDLSIAYWVYNLLLTNLNKDKHFETFLQSFQDNISSVDKEILQKYDEHVAEGERETLDTDMKLDIIMDSIVEAMKKTEIDENLEEDSDLPDCSDSD